MSVMHTVPARAGQRIQGYRNSQHRTVNLFGVGEGGRDVARRIGERHLPGVVVTEEAGGMRLPLLDDLGQEPRPNLIVIVYRVGDRAELPTFPEKPDPTVTLVLLESPGNPPPMGDESVRVLRSMADLFVTTSDEDFAYELISNLAS